MAYVTIQIEGDKVPHSNAPAVRVYDGKTLLHTEFFDSRVDVAYDRALEWAISHGHTVRRSVADDGKFRPANGSFWARGK